VSVVAVIRVAPLSEELERIADKATSEKWRERFRVLARQAERLESAVTEGRWQIEELQTEVTAAREDERERWAQAADTFHEAHRALGHLGTATLCSAELCRRMTRVFDNP
jgi:chromosome segregation ATPase